MPYRDDHEALLARSDELERELAQARAEIERLAADNARLRHDQDEEVEVAGPGRELIMVSPSPAFEVRSGAQAAGLVLCGWALSAVALGAGAWVVAPAVLSALAIGALVGASHRSPIAGRHLVPSDLPIDRTAYGALLTAERDSVVVRIEVRFIVAPSSTERSRILKRWRHPIHVAWDNGLLVIDSGILQTTDRRHQHDPSPILRFCDPVWERLTPIHASWPIAAITPLARRVNADREPV